MAEHAPPGGEPSPRVLVVSPSFVLRNSYSSALEDDGCSVLEAASADEVLWSLVAGKTGAAVPIDLIVADAATPGAQALLAEVRASPAPPALVLVNGAPPEDERLRGVAVVADARRIEAMRAAVGDALTERARGHPRVR